MTEIAQFKVNNTNVIFTKNKYYFEHIKLAATI